MQLAAVAPIVLLVCRFKFVYFFAFVRFETLAAKLSLLLDKFLLTVADFAVNRHPSFAF